YLGGEVGDVLRHVRAAEEEGSVLGRAVQRCLLDERGDDLDGARGAARSVRVAAGAAQRRDHVALERRDDEVRLRVAAVDADHYAQARNFRFASIIRSASVSARSTWPISGCASSARKTLSRPPRRAASS